MTRQGWLLWIWLCGFLACFIAILALGPLGDERLSNLPTDAQAIGTVYSPYLLPIISFWFAKHSKDKSEPSSTSSVTFWVAAVFSTVFNLVILGFVVSIHFQSAGIDVAQNTLTLIPKIAAVLSVFVGPAIGFFFGKST
jgi:hypothetical protein